MHQWVLNDTMPAPWQLKLAMHNGFSVLAQHGRLSARKHADNATQQSYPYEISRGFANHCCTMSELISRAFNNFIYDCRQANIERVTVHDNLDPAVSNNRIKNLVRGFVRNFPEKNRMRIEDISMLILSFAGNILHWDSSILTLSQSNIIGKLLAARMSNGMQYFQMKKVFEFDGRENALTQLSFDEHCEHVQHTVIVIRTNMNHIMVSYCRLSSKEFVSMYIHGDCANGLLEQTFSVLLTGYGSFPCRFYPYADSEEVVFYFPGDYTISKSFEARQLRVLKHQAFEDINPKAMQLEMNAHDFPIGPQIAGPIYVAECEVFSVL